LPPDLPAVTGQCPTLTDGATVTLGVGGGSMQARIWMGAQGGGPVILYWHGTGSTPDAEVPMAFDTSAIVAAGGILFGFDSASRQGPTDGGTGPGVWYESDAAFADQAVACAIRDHHMDPTRIHSAGAHAGGFQTVYMSYARSGYLASVIIYSAGLIGMINQVSAQDASNLPAALVAHGTAADDTNGDIIINNAAASSQWEMSIKQEGGSSIDCEDADGHLLARRMQALQGVAFKFFEDHPFGVQIDPDAGALPSLYPSYCKID
jgi:poly(3-hydroxybutyrate) depolymerase